MRMATKPKMYRLDVEVLEAWDRFCMAKKERQTAMVQRIMIETMKRAGYWPPKAKEGK